MSEKFFPVTLNHVYDKSIITREGNIGYLASFIEFTVIYVSIDLQILSNYKNTVLHISHLVLFLSNALA